MATKNTTFKFKDADLELIDGLARDMGCSRTQVLRIAVRDLRKARGLYLDTATAFIASLKAKFGEEADLRVELDEYFDAFASVDGVRRDDIYTPSIPTTYRDDEGNEEDFAKVYLGDPQTDVRILLGLLPLRSGVPLVLGLEELEPNMSPKAAAWFPAGQ